MPLKRLGVAAASVVVVIAAASCQEPTRVVVEARTNVVYKEGYVTAFTVGPHASLEGTAPTTESREPWGADGFVGSLVVVPGASNPDSLSVKLVLGVRRDARECEPPSYAGCIVARRKLRYVEHERLRLPITLYAQCENVPCDAESTCNFLGQCVSATVDQGSCEGDDGCTVTGDRPTTPPRPGDDASVIDVDGASPPDAADGNVTDATSEAALDAPKDAINESSNQEAGVAGFVYCPPSMCNAPTQKCCTNGGISMCVPTNASCTQPSVAAQCDGREDCGGGYCCVENDGLAKCRTTACPTGAGYWELCHTDLDCSGGRACKSDALYASTWPTCQ